MPIENCEETKVTHEYLVKLDNDQENIKCRIIETKNTDTGLPFSYEAEFISDLEPIDCKTHYGAFTNLSRYLARLIEPRQKNNNYL